MSGLVSWYFEPGQPQKITPGLWVDGADACLTDPSMRMKLGWSLRTLFLLVCQVKGTVGESGLCLYVPRYSYHKVKILFLWHKRWKLSWTIFIFYVMETVSSPYVMETVSSPYVMETVSSPCNIRVTSVEGCSFAWSIDPSSIINYRFVFLFVFSSENAALLKTASSSPLTSFSGPPSVVVNGNRGIAPILEKVLIEERRQNCIVSQAQTSLVLTNDSTLLSRAKRVASLSKYVTPWWSVNLERDVPVRGVVIYRSNPGQFFFTSIAIFDLVYFYRSRWWWLYSALI